VKEIFLRSFLRGRDYTLRKQASQEAAKRGF
jgi:hypothetical protein